MYGLRGGDEGVGLFGGVFPAVDLLAGADEDAGADGRLAEPVNVEFGDVAEACLRCRQEAENDEVQGEGDFRAARGRVEDDGVRDGDAADAELEVNEGAWEPRLRTAGRVWPAGKRANCSC